MLLEKLKSLNIGTVLENEPMKNHTTFKIGGPADIFVIPSGESELIEALKAVKESDMEYTIIGNGSNLLVSDLGIRGVVIAISEGFNKIEIEDGDIINVGAGLLVSSTSKFAQRNSLAGMEFASGIPGSIGGGITMNAGAYGGEFIDIVKDVTVLTKDLEVKTLTNSEMNFRYRNSAVKDQDLIVLSTRLQLKKDDKEKIDALVSELNFKRTSRQPLELPSAGSTFKRPEGYYAAALIEEAGMKGAIHGGAMVSDKHSGFVVNIDNATFKDVIELIRLIQKEVFDHSGVMLEPEVKIIGEGV